MNKFNTDTYHVHTKYIHSLNMFLKVCLVGFEDIQSICSICHVHTLYVPEENRKKKFHDVGIRTLYLMHTARLL
jgi:hypothetical protein